MQKTIKEIISGVIEAQQFTSENNAMVNPPTTHRKDQRLLYEKNDGEFWYGEELEFDIAIEATGSDTAEGGIAVFGGAINLGTKGKIEELQSQVNRIKYTIPIFCLRNDKNTIIILT